MALEKVTDPETLARLEGFEPVTDQATIDRLEGKSEEPLGKLRQLVKNGANLVETPGRGLRALGVGAETLALHPTQPGNAVLRANEALSADYAPQSGERLGAFAGDMLDPVTLALGEVAEPLKVGKLAKAAIQGASIGGGTSILDQLAHKGNVNLGEAAGNAGGAGALSALLHLPATKAFGRFGESVTGKPAREFNRILDDPKLMLPESLGGAEKLPKAGVTFENALKNAGVEKKSLDFPKTATKRDMTSFVTELETDLDRKAAGEQGINVSTKDLIKGNRVVNRIVESLGDKGENQSLKRAWMETKLKIKSEISERNDELAKSFNKYSRAKTKDSLSTFLGDNKFVLRRAFLGATTLNPVTAGKVFAATSPKALSALETASALTPTYGKAVAAKKAIDILRERRKHLTRDSSE